MAFTCMKFPWGLHKFALGFFSWSHLFFRSHPTLAAAVSSEKAVLLQMATVANAEAELSGPAGMKFNVMVLELDSNRLLATGQCLGWQTEMTKIRNSDFSQD